MAIGVPLRLNGLLRCTSLCASTQEIQLANRNTLFPQNIVRRCDMEKEVWQSIHLCYVSQQYTGGWQNDTDLEVRESSEHKFAAEHRYL